MADAIDLSGFLLLDIYGLERVQLVGDFSEDALAQRFIDEWVPLLECHKCSRSDYCKFAEPIAHGSARMREIQCGVVATSIRNFVRVTFPLIQSLSHDQLQEFLDAAHHLSRFLFDAEIRIGSSLDAAYIDDLGDWAAPFFGRFVHLRDHLNGLAGGLRHIPELRAQKGFILVEGPSERAFVERLRLSHMGWFISIQVDSYAGKGSRGPRRLEFLLSRLAQQGYRVHIQGDADGGPLNIFDALTARGLVDSQCTFVFPHDFETAVPDKLALSAFKRIGLLTEVEASAYAEATESHQGNLAAKLLRAYSLDLEPHKVAFAQAVADFVNWARDWRWFNDQEFLASDLGRFLQFLRSAQ